MTTRPRPARDVIAPLCRPVLALAPRHHVKAELVPTDEAVRAELRRRNKVTAP